MANNNRRESKSRPEEILEYITTKGWPYRLEGNNFKIETCLFCGNPAHNFEIHKDKGMYSCWACGVKGSFYNLKDYLGDTAFSVRKLEDDTSHITQERKEQLTDMALNYHDAIWNCQPVLDYIRSRGFMDETIQKFKFGAHRDSRGKYWLTIPHIVGDKVVNIKSRSIPPDKKAWLQEKDSQKVLFNHNALSKFDSIILTEGELKTAALWQMGFENTVSLTGGIQNFRPEWVDIMDTIDKIYFCLDSDIAGQKGAEDLAMRLGPEKCFNIILKDAKDPDEWFFEKNHTAEEFEQLLRIAKPIDIENIVSLNKAFSLLQEKYLVEDSDLYKGLQTPWEGVNRLIHGFKPGELIILSGPPKFGKTSLALEIGLYQASIDNPSLLFCMEMNAERLAQKITCNILNISSGIMNYDHITHARYLARKYPFYLSAGVKRGITTEQIFTGLKAAYRRYGLKLIIFDNLHFMVRSSNNLREQLGEASQNFKLLAEELKIPIILLVHPRKLNKQGPMTADDFRETGTIHADADQIIMLHREKHQATSILNSDQIDPEGNQNTAETTLLDPRTDVIVDSGRFTEGGKYTLWFDGAKSKFITLQEAGRETL